MLASFCSIPDYLRNSNGGYDDYECNESLLEHAKITATSSLRERGPENARLNGEYKLTEIINNCN